ncbi:6-phosphogluconate dehydrogenase-like protein NAD-binding protein [Rhizodiscina lignyota]|uniref:6-phosphogluconate dehydrogenase-like protein NAD-binding protein n=1 Tax=Rhizodiscina lignyota TaxID=1504668 RepID=A0A9P4IEW5_9PEZI|nr:6-phosphogluconate dehydrogenase-like protein NAD-binding protein [Rhizodiscina lignyota]
MAPQLAFMGLGNMGRGMCKNLVEKGNLDKPLILWNRTQKRADDLAATLGTSGAKVASTIQDAVKPADIIFICVGDDKADRETVDTITSVNVDGKLIVDCSTVHPDTTLELESTLAAKGAAFVAMPVFGAPAMADAGQLICIMAGPKDALERVTPYCKGVMARAEIKFPDEPQSKAPLLKLIGNSMILQMVESIAEGLTLAEKSGLGADHLHEWIGLMWPGAYPAYSQRMIKGDYYKRDEPLFAVDLARKDAGHVLKIADDSGAKVRAVELVDHHLLMAKNYAGTKGDLAGMYGAVRQEAGLAYENDPEDKGKAKAES